MKQFIWPNILQIIQARFHKSQINPVYSLTFAKDFKQSQTQYIRSQSLKISAGT